MKKLIVGIILAVSMVVGPIGVVSTVQADGVKEAIDVLEDSSPTTKTDVRSVVKIVVDTMLYIVGIISVIMIIFGGIKYATSAGDTGKVTQAKNTLVYAVVGLLVAVFAFALVNWVLKGVGAGE